MISGKYEIVLGAGLATVFWAVASLFSNVPLPSPSQLKDFAGPAATVIAAFAAGWIAYSLGQSQISVAKSQADTAARAWQTSNEKLVLELFDKRLKVYEEIREVIAEVARSGTARSDTLGRFYRAIDRVPYFFGQEVQDFIEQIRLAMIDLDLANTMLNQHVDPGVWSQKRHDYFLRVTAFYKQAPPLFEPYIRAHQKSG